MILDCRFNLLVEFVEETVIVSVLIIAIVLLIVADVFEVLDIDVFIFVVIITMI